MKWRKTFEPQGINMTPERKRFIIELAAMVIIAFAISLLLGYFHGKVSWTACIVAVVLAALIVCIPHRTLCPKKISQKEFDELSVAVEENRLKLIKKLGWHWEVRGASLCRINNQTGEVLESIDQRMVAEVWGINTDEGPFLEDFWLLCVCNDHKHSIGSEIITEEIWNWFFALDGFDFDAHLECMQCTDNRKTLLWRRSPLTCIWSDGWVLTSLLLTGQRSVTLDYLMAVADCINHAILNTDEVNHALSVLCPNGYLSLDENGNILLADKAETIKDKPFEKASAHDKIGIVQKHLAQHATISCPEVKEYFTDDDMKKAYEKYTGGMRKRNGVKK